MALLAAGLAIFCLVHFVPSRASLHAGLVSKLGANGWRGVSALISLGAFYLIVNGYGAAERVPVWEPPSWGKAVTMGVMLLACLSLGAYAVKSHLGAWLKQPMTVAVTLWAVAHLFMRGDGASILLFGTFALFGAWKVVELTRRGAIPDASGLPAYRDLLALILGSALYAALIWAHEYIIGISLVG